MSTDDETLGFYDRAAGDYADTFAAGDPADPDLRAFMDDLPSGARVLDFGCGPGQHAAAMIRAGIAVDAMDASAGMVAEAKARFGVTARQATFADLDAGGEFDGIWANFSLLHAPRAEMPAHLNRLARALRPGGVLHIGVKSGEGEKRDHLGRLYTFYAEDELRGWLADAGFTVTALRHGHGKGMAGTDDPFIILRARLG